MDDFSIEKLTQEPKHILAARDFKEGFSSWFEEQNFTPSILLHCELPQLDSIEKGNYASQSLEGNPTDDTSAISNFIEAFREARIEVYYNEDGKPLENTDSNEHDDVPLRELTNKEKEKKITDHLRNVQDFADNADQETANFCRVEIFFIDGSDQFASYEVFSNLVQEIENFAISASVNSNFTLFFTSIKSGDRPVISTKVGSDAIDLKSIYDEYKNELTMDNPPPEEFLVPLMPHINVIFYPND